jgi:quercetin dioxygenase-like cupin family protein
MQKLSLDALAREQLDAARRSPAGRAAHTAVGGHEHVMRQTVIALLSGRTLAEHVNPGEATVQVLLGRVRLVSGDEAWEGRHGDLLIVPPAPHSLEALEDAAVLLSVAKRGSHTP